MVNFFWGEDFKGIYPIKDIATNHQRRRIKSKPLSIAQRLFFSDVSPWYGINGKYNNEIYFFSFDKLFLLLSNIITYQTKNKGIQWCYYYSTKIDMEAASSCCDEGKIQVLYSHFAHI